MSSWDSHNRAKLDQQKKKRQLLWGALIGGVFAFLLAGIIYLFWPEPEVVNLATITAVAQQPEDAATAKDIAETEAQAVVQGRSFSTIFSPATFFSSTEEAQQQKINRLQENIANQETTRFQYAQEITSRGPQRLEFTVSASGTVHNHAIGLATYADTNVVGAANEWQVRPWWRLGWLPTTSDCGQVGTAAIGGHVSWLERPGPLHDLGAMQAGDQVRCQAQTGTWYTYEVYEVVQIGYENTRYYWQPPKNRFDSELSIFSCKPELTGIIVVRAKLVAS